MHKEDDHIRFIAIGSLLDRKIIVQYVPQKKREKVYKYERAASDIFEKLILISITANERHTETIGNDLRIVTYVDKSTLWCFLAIITQDFPERIAYQMLSDLENRTLRMLNSKFLNVNIDDCPGLKADIDSTQLYIVELHRKYNDPGNVDRLRVMKKDMDDIKVEMKSNVNKILKNIDEVKYLENQSTNLKKKAEEYKNTAHDLKKVSKWANWKVKLALGGAGGCAATYFIWSWFFKA